MKKKFRKPLPESSSEDPNRSIRWVVENLEVLAGGVLVALLVNFFCMGVFRIPTPSMEPTLVGREVEGDRILVDRSVYQLEDPQRWDVVVFRYPLKKSENYIKRLVGLPGEEILLAGGNVYVKEGTVFQVARKPEDVQEALWQEIFPEEDGETRSVRTWIGLEGTRLDFPLEEDGFRILPAGEEGWARFDRRLSARRKSSEGMGDGKLEFTAIPAAGVKSVHLEWTWGKERFLLTLTLSDGKAVLLRNEKTAAQGTAVLPPEESSRVVFAHVDGRVSLSLDGDEVLACEYNPPCLRSPAELGAYLSIGVFGGELECREVAVYRDIYHFNEGVLGPGRSLTIGPEQFLVLGDNSLTSKDSRLWQRVRFALKDGRTFEADLDNVDSAFILGRGDATAFTDVHGREIELSREELSGNPEVRSTPFVPAEDLIGRAFFVFWPFPRVRAIR